MAEPIVGTVIAVGGREPEPPPEGKAWALIAVPIEDARRLPLYGDVRLSSTPLLSAWDKETLLQWARHFGATDGSWPEGQALVDKIQALSAEVPHG